MNAELKPKRASQLNLLFYPDAIFKNEFSADHLSSLNLAAIFNGRIIF